MKIFLKYILRIGQIHIEIMNQILLLELQMNMIEVFHLHQKTDGATLLLMKLKLTLSIFAGQGLLQIMI